MSLVLDSSVAAAWCVEEEQTPALMALLGGIGASGAVALSLWPLEMTNTLVLAARRNRSDAGKQDGLIRFLRTFPVHI